MHGCRGCCASVISPNKIYIVKYLCISTEIVNAKLKPHGQKYSLLDLILQMQTLTKMHILMDASTLLENKGSHFHKQWRGSSCNEAGNAYLMRHKLIYMKKHTQSWRSNLTAKHTSNSLRYICAALYLLTPIQIDSHYTTDVALHIHTHTYKLLCQYPGDNCPGQLRQATQ